MSHTRTKWPWAIVWNTCGRAESCSFFRRGPVRSGPGICHLRAGPRGSFSITWREPGPPLQVIPVGIHYECPWAFRSKVEVVLGKPISIELAPGSSRLGRLKELKRRIECGLEEVGVNVESAEHQDKIQRLAYAATLATKRSYFESLKALEGGVPMEC